jgi:hypothetical protein
VSKPCLLRSDSLNAARTLVVWRNERRSAMVRTREGDESRCLADGESGRNDMMTDWKASLGAKTKLVLSVIRVRT